MLPNERFTLCLLLAAFAVAAAGCGKAEDDDGGADAPIAFATAVGPADTRAGELNTDNLASMGVIGYYTGQSQWATAATAAAPNFMNDQRVAKSGSTWTYSPVKYWPNTAGDKLTFFAYAPHSADTYNSGTGEGVYNVASGAGSLKIYYRTPVKEKEQVDLLAATGLLNRTRSNAPLNFAMQHMLTKVEFRVKSSSDIKVDVLRLINVATVAYVEFDKTSGVPQVKVLSSGDPGYRADVVEAYLGAGGSTDVPANEDPAVPGTTIATFYLPPLKPELAGFKYGDESLTAISLPGDDLWKPGKHVIYTIVIEKTKLTVTASTGSSGQWTDGGSFETDCGNF